MLSLFSEFILISLRKIKTFFNPLVKIFHCFSKENNTFTFIAQDIQIQKILCLIIPAFCFELIDFCNFLPFSLYSLDVFSNKIKPMFNRNSTDW